MKLNSLGTKVPKLYMLIGIPCSGKSTWVENQEWAKDCAIISTDIYVEAYANAVNKTYSEVFEMYMPKAVELMTQDVIAAHAADKDIIWDQTSITKASRMRKFKMLPNYYAIAVVFPVPEKQELHRRLMSRPGKIIPEHVIERMISEYQLPKMTEGFKEIWHAN